MKNLKADDNTEWPHFPNYTIVRKVKQQIEGVFDYVLLPPMIIKNCLPSLISLEIVEEFKDTKDIKSSDLEVVKPNS